MIESILLYLGGGLPLAWGISHLFPTRGVVDGFGEISVDNRRIIMMEWILEGVALVFLGSIVCLATWIDPGSPVARAVYWSAFLGLNAFSVVSVFTGARIRLLPFRLCPLIFSGSSLLILAALLLGAR